MSPSTRRLADATAIVVNDAPAETLGLPTEVTVRCSVSFASLAALAGTATFTHTVVHAPPATVGVVVSGVVHVASYVVVGQVPDVPRL